MPAADGAEQVADALYIACRNGQVDVVEFLLGKQPDLSFRAYLGATPLHWAYFGGSRTVVDLLERAGADPSARDDTLGCTPRAFGICAPANWGFAFLVRARLAEDPALANIMDGRTSPLHEAARSGSAEVVRLLLDHGADASRTDGDGKTPLELATDRGHAAVAEMLRGATGALAWRMSLQPLSMDCRPSHHGRGCGDLARANGDEPGRNRGRVYPSITLSDVQAALG